VIITLIFTVFAEVVVTAAGRASDLLYSGRSNTQLAFCTYCSGSNPVDPVTLCIANARCPAGFNGRCSVLLSGCRDVCVGKENPTYAGCAYTVNVSIKPFRRNARVVLFVSSFVCSSVANAYLSGTGMTAQQRYSAGGRDRLQR